MIKFLGHASLLIETENAVIAVDPWFSKTGAFLYNWHQFPDNSSIDMSWKDRLDFVCISHEHEDHFDKLWLQTLNDNVKIVIPKYKNRRFYNLLKEVVDNEIIEVRHKSVFDLNGVEYTPIIQVPGWDDACLIFKTEDEVIVNANDMSLGPDDKKWINENFDNVDYLFFQVAGASWHPHAYEYSDERQREIRKSKIKSYIKKAENLVNALSPDVSIPCAGPPCFLDDEFFHLNFIEDSIFMTGDFIYKTLSKKLENKLVLVTPGDTIPNQEGCDSLSITNLNKECYTDKKKYLQKYKDRRIKLINKSVSNITRPKTKSLFNKTIDYFEPLIKSNKFFREKSKGKLLINIEGHIQEKILIDFSKEENNVNIYNNEECYYVFNIDSKYLNMIYEKKLFWEDLFLSFRFKAFRSPDEFDQLLINFLKFADASCFRYLERHYKKMEKNKKLKETFIKKVNGKMLKIQRYCPHALADLSTGYIKDDCIVCPMHSWEFSLKNGKCKTNTTKIKVRNV